MVTALWPYVPARTMTMTRHDFFTFLLIFHFSIVYSIKTKNNSNWWSKHNLNLHPPEFKSKSSPPSHTASTMVSLQQSNFKWFCWLIYLISMYKSCFPSGHYLSIDKASDLTGMKSVVGVNYCDHVPLQKHYRINTYQQYDDENTLFILQYSPTDTIL